MPAPRQVVSLFTGVAGLDQGLEAGGFHVRQMCESWEPARRVLRAHYPQVRVAEDVATARVAMRPWVLAAGFPCTNISHVGDKTGLDGAASGLVRHVFEIAEATKPHWVLLENVPNLLTLNQGSVMRHVLDRLESLGYSWAYRTVDSRFTGVPQRRPRVVILASRRSDPAFALLTQDAGEPDWAEDPGAWGFYWTEGRHGTGLVADAIPTLKGGSTLGLASAPAIWLPGQPVGRRIVLPSVEQGEQLQGLTPGWTSAAVVDGEPDMRWKLIGNAVTVGVGQWLAERMTAADEVAGTSMPRADGRMVDRHRRWPGAAWGAPGKAAYASEVSRWPVRQPYTHLADLIDPTSATPLSHRAVAGFLSRLAESGLPIEAQLYSDLELHLSATRPIMNKVARGRAKDVPGKESWASSTKVRRRMQATGPRDTKPEVRLRRALTARDLRYRLQIRPEADLRWRMDIVFTRARVAVDVRGCFWHACSIHGTKPRSNADRWAKKLADNKARDDRIEATLTERGWAVVVVWEHEDPEEAADRIAEIVRARREIRPSVPRSA